MADVVKYIYGTEAQILELTIDDEKWIDKAFYYPSDKSYFYQIIEGSMKRYGRTDAEIIGLATIEETEETFSTPKNIIANLGFGNEEDAPALVSLQVGDTYITDDSFLIFVVTEEMLWEKTALKNTQFITDISNSTELPPLYQFYNDIFIPIANYKTSELPDLPE